MLAHLLSSKTRGSSSSSAGDVVASSLAYGMLSARGALTIGEFEVRTCSVLSCVFARSLSDLLSLSSLSFLSSASSFLSPFASFSLFFFCFSSYSLFTRSTSSSSSRFLRASIAAWSIFGVQKPVSFRWAGQT